MKKRMKLLSAMAFVLAFTFACSTPQQAPTPAPTPAPGPAPSAPAEETPPAAEPGTPAGPVVPGEAPVEGRSMEEVKQIAINSVGSGNGVITKYEVKAPENADWTYAELEIQVDSQEHDVDIDRRTGSVREKNVESNRNMIIDYSAYIGLEEAERIALERVGEAGSLIIEFELEDIDDNDPVSYDFEILAPSGQFEVEVDAMNGEVRKFERT